MAAIRMSHALRLLTTSACRGLGRVLGGIVGLAALLVVVLSLSPGSTAWAGFFDDVLEGAEDVVKDTTDYIEDKVSGEAKEGVDDFFEGEQPEAQPPAEQPQVTPPQTAAPQQPSANQPSPSSTGGQSQVEMAMEVQDRLNQLGYNAGPVDGLPGTKTVNAIAAFQRDHGLVEDGNITAALVDALRAAHQAQLAQPQVEEPAQSSEAGAPPSGMSQAELTRETQERLNALGYDAGAADGVYGLKTGLAIAAFQRANGLSETGNVSAALVEALRTAGAGAQPATTAAQPQVAQPAQPAANLPPVGGMSQTELTRETQERLNALGYDAGAADGVYGLKTGLAIAAFQRDNGLSETGNVSAALVEALRTTGAQPTTTAAQVAETSQDAADGAEATGIAGTWVGEYVCGQAPRPWSSRSPTRATTKFRRCSRFPPPRTIRRSQAAA